MLVWISCFCSWIEEIQGKRVTWNECLKIGFKQFDVRDEISHLCARRCVGFTHLPVPVILQHHQDTRGVRKHVKKKRHLCDVGKKPERWPTVALFPVTFQLVVCPREESTWSGIWGRPSKHTLSCARALFFGCSSAYRRSPRARPWLEFRCCQGLRPVDNEPEPIILSQWIERNRAKNESHRAN